MPVHQCNVCSKTFSRSTKLREHIRSHTGERPFECPTCKTKFSRSYDLTKHKQIHGGSHRYRCTFEEDGRTLGCGKGFHKKGDLNRHRERANANSCRQVEQIADKQNVELPGRLVNEVDKSGPSTGREQSSPTSDPPWTDLLPKELDSPPSRNTPTAGDGSVPADQTSEEDTHQSHPPPSEVSLRAPRRAFLLHPTTVSSEASSRLSGSSMEMTGDMPRLDLSSPEMLALRFDKVTCGILSINDGPTENPWRTMIWPLARESEALYHAICSVTAFHGAFEDHDLRVTGLAHKTKSIKTLAVDIEHMPPAHALATVLTLTLSERWDSDVSIETQHLSAARIMVNNVVRTHGRSGQFRHPMTSEQERWRFLCNTFVYMDVISRLTSLEATGGLDLDEILDTVNPPPDGLIEIDPLMGCAMTLFPIISRAAALIQKVRKTESNSLAILSHAMELKEQLEKWQKPSLLERPGDPSGEVQHSIQTAEAYRVAMLLHLHQSVPEIPAQSSEVLAKRVLVTLASVPLSSRAVIVQVFPLLAAGCEMTSEEDRSWVLQRWNAMLLRLKTGTIKSCLVVMREVWARRDAYEAGKANEREPPQQSNDSEILVDGHKVRLSELGRYMKRRQASRTPSTSEHGVIGRGFEETEQDSRPPEDSWQVIVDSLSASDVPITGPMRQPLPLGERTSQTGQADQLEPEYTVRGKLHWLGVMDDWAWEVFLG